MAVRFVAALWVVFGSVAPFVEGAFEARQATWTPNIKLNLTFPAHSALLGMEDFTTYYDWNTSFTDSSWAEYEPGLLGMGTSKRVSQSKQIKDDMRPYSSLHLYDGPITGFWFYGRSLGPPESEKNITLRLDGVTSNVNPAGPTLVAVTGLTFAKHSMELGVLEAAGALAEVDQFVVETGFYSAVSTFEEVNTTVVPFVVDSNNGKVPNPDMRWTTLNANGPNGWTVVTSLGGKGGQPTVDTAIAQTCQRSDVVTVYVPANTSMALLNATIGPGNGAVAMSWKPAPPYLANNPHEVYLYNAWVRVNEVASWTVLDPAETYSIDIRGYEMFQSTGSECTQLNSMTFYSAGTESPSNTTQEDQTPNSQDAQSSKRKPNIGAIVGEVIGGVVGIALLVGLTWWLATRHSRRPKRVDPDTFEVDGFDDGVYSAAVDPYPVQTRVTSKEDYEGYNDQQLSTPMSVKHWKGIRANVRLARDAPQPPSPQPPPSEKQARPQHQSFPGPAPPMRHVPRTVVYEEDGGTYVPQAFGSGGYTPMSSKAGSSSRPCW